jgi:glycosyltransferase involved in cell wall biosynthesis
VDGMPLTVLEAQALGKPVVASRVGSLPEMIEDEVSGFLCDVADVSAFCRRILQLASDPDLRERMGLAAQEIGLKKYSADGMLDDYEQIIHNAHKDAERKTTARAQR